MECALNKRIRQIKVETRLEAIVDMINNVTEQHRCFHDTQRFASPGNYSGMEKKQQNEMDEVISA